MTHPERNQRVLIAMTLAGRGADLRAAQYEKVVGKVVGNERSDAYAFNGHLARVDGFSPDHLAQLVQAVAASAAFGVDESSLGVLLNYLEVEEARYFQLDKAFLELFTMNELESLAVEMGLRKAMGERFKSARSAKKDAFIDALLAVKGFEYRGAVPRVMRYPRKPLRDADALQEACATTVGNGSENGAPSQECEDAVAA